MRPVTPAARTLRTLIVAALVGAFALAWGGDGFWVCLPGALVLASAEPSPRGRPRRRRCSSSRSRRSPRRRRCCPPRVVVPASVGILLALRSRLERERDAMRRFALRDPLTGLANRRALDERLGYEIARHTRHGESLRGARARPRRLQGGQRPLRPRRRRRAAARGRGRARSRSCARRTRSCASAATSSACSRRRPARPARTT